MAIVELVGESPVSRRYLRKLMNRLELRDWKLFVADHPAPPDHDAHITWAFGQKVAVLEFGTSFADEEPEAQRQIICHELIHLHLAVITQMVEQDLKREMSPAAHDVFWQGWKRQMEYTVDGLATAFAKEA